MDFGIPASHCASVNTLSALEWLPNLSAPIHYFQTFLYKLVPCTPFSIIINIPSLPSLKHHDPNKATNHHNPKRPASQTAIPLGSPRIQHPSPNHVHLLPRYLLTVRLCLYRPFWRRRNRPLSETCRLWYGHPLERKRPQTHRLRYRTGKEREVPLALQGLGRERW